ncbi:MAG: sigma factor-like helix-turn-helix DNA-binding protein [Veillonella parvula]|uniref:sigma factor-like helix-turn-helix DNA-binding protein n=1 Tax=Veillonella parvula TaxID=29466 RepID=UPI0039A0A3EA
MRTSSFEHVVRLQFNSLMMIVIKNKLKSRNRQLARRSKREVLLCEMTETTQAEYGTNDTYFYECVSFEVLHFTIYVSDETLGTVLHRLSEKQRSAILLRYFQGMNDREISELYYVSRSAISSRRSRGLKKLEMLLNERK